MVPRLLLLTDRRASEANGRDVVATVELALAAGAPAVLLREKDLDVTARTELAVALRRSTAAVGAQLLVAGDAALARRTGADGCHLAATDPFPDAAPPLLVGRSCHTQGEVVAARDEGAHYVTVSPVAPSPSKPGYAPLARGAAAVAELAAAGGPTPALALGGVTPDNARRWLDAGAYGLAVMGGVMRAHDPAAVVRELLATLTEGVR